MPEDNNPRATKSRRLAEDRSCDEFICVECQRPIISLPAVDPPPIICATCAWLDVYVNDADEREELRHKLMMDPPEGAGA